MTLQELQEKWSGEMKKCLIEQKRSAIKDGEYGLSAMDQTRIEVRLEAAIEESARVGFEAGIEANVHPAVANLPRHATEHLEEARKQFFGDKDQQIK